MPPSSSCRFCDSRSASHRAKPGSGSEAFARRGFKNQRIPCRLAANAPRRGGRAVECGGLENRFGRFRPTRVQIPPPPLFPFATSPRPGRPSRRDLSLTFSVYPISKEGDKAFLFTSDPFVGR